VQRHRGLGQQQKFWFTTGSRGVKLSFPFVLILFAFCCMYPHANTEMCTTFYLTTDTSWLLMFWFWKLEKMSIILFLTAKRFIFSSIIIFSLQIIINVINYKTSVRQGFNIPEILVLNNVNMNYLNPLRIFINIVRFYFTCTTEPI
jgi:hypothetical protein